MDPVAIVNLSLIALNAVLTLIGKVRSQSGMTDDAILLQAQQMVDANDTLYTTLQATLKALPPASPTV